MMTRQLFKRFIFFMIFMSRLFAGLFETHFQNFYK